MQVLTVAPLARLAVPAQLAQPADPRVPLELLVLQVQLARRALAQVALDKRVPQVPQVQPVRPVPQVPQAPQVFKVQPDPRVQTSADLPVPLARLAQPALLVARLVPLPLLVQPVPQVRLDRLVLHLPARRVQGGRLVPLVP